MPQIIKFLFDVAASKNLLVNLLASPLAYWLLHIQFNSQLVELKAGLCGYSWDIGVFFAEKGVNIVLTTITFAARIFPRCCRFGCVGKLATSHLEFEIGNLIDTPDLGCVTLRIAITASDHSFAHKDTEFHYNPQLLLSIQCLGLASLSYWAQELLLCKILVFFAVHLAICALLWELDGTALTTTGLAGGANPFAASHFGLSLPSDLDSDTSSPSSPPQDVLWQPHGYFSDRG